MIWHKDLKDPIQLPPRSSTLFFMQRLRDETHRFAIGFHKKQRSKALIKTAIDDIPSIGKKKRLMLLNHFGSVKKLKEATREDLAELDFLNKTNIGYLLDFIEQE